jgi:predicted porin
MKKLLIATAALAMVAGTAQAQSSVTVYGGIDINVSTINDDAAVDSTASGMGASSVYSSRLGFKGTEDLGGGLKANFVLESSLTPTTGAMGASSATTNGSANFFNRGAWAGLQNSFGEIRLGRQDVSNISNADSAVSTAGNLGIAKSGFNLGGDKDKSVVAIARANGFEFQAGHSSANTATVSGVTSATTNQVDAVSLQYTNGPLTAIVATAEERAAAATDNLTQTSFGLKYDFGKFAVSAFRSSKAEDDKGVNLNYTILTASMPLGGGLTAGAQFLDYNDKVTATNNEDTYRVSLAKAFSKRTTGYAAVHTHKTNSTATPTAKGLTVGVVHLF